MSQLYEKVLDVLRGHMSDIHARSLLRRAVQTEGTDERGLNARHLPRVISQLQRSAVLFISEESKASLRSAFEEIVQQRERVEPVTIVIRTESDIITARSKAREMCQLIGGGRMQIQRVATVVSELARNIQLYAPGGRIELLPQSNPGRVLIRAVDRGGGIPNLDQIMAGSYRSKTGMGMGLLGSKRLADSFDIETGVTGTKINAEVTL